MARSAGADTTGLVSGVADVCRWLLACVLLASTCRACLSVCALWCCAADSCLLFARLGQGRMGVPNARGQLDSSLHERGMDLDGVSPSSVRPRPWHAPYMMAIILSSMHQSPSSSSCPSSPRALSLSRQIMITSSITSSVSRGRLEFLRRAGTLRASQRRVRGICALAGVVGGITDLS